MDKDLQIIEGIVAGCIEDGEPLGWIQGNLVSLLISMRNFPATKPLADYEQDVLAIYERLIAEGKKTIWNIHSMPAPIPPYKYPKLINIINGTYSDGIDEIVSARTEDDKAILCICRDGRKQLDVKITSDEITIRLMNADGAA